MEDEQKFHTVRGYQIIEKDKKLLTPAMEDYLEMIYRNSLKEGYIRINALSELLNVRASSTTKMVQRLSILGLIDYKRYGIIFLTEKGREIGSFLLERHNIVETFLNFLGAEQNVLAETELIEHNIGSDTLDKINLLNKFFLANPGFHKEFENHVKNFNTK